MKDAILLALLFTSAASAQPFIRTQVPGRAEEDLLCVTWNKREFVYVVDSAGSATGFASLT